jgi:hypothetical protein
MQLTHNRAQHSNGKALQADHFMHAQREILCMPGELEADVSAAAPAAARVLFGIFRLLRLLHPLRCAQHSTA